jgi:signal transduction protein with GAF and PtsI domain
MRTESTRNLQQELTHLGLQDIIVNLFSSLSALKKLSEISCQVDDEKHLILQALTYLIQNQDMESCSFFILDEDGLLTNVTGLSAAELTKRPQRNDKPLRFKIGEGIIGAAAETGQTQHCRNSQQSAIIPSYRAPSSAPRYSP